MGAEACSVVVYELKCVLDEILNSVENLTDGLLNAIRPLLAPLIDKYTASACLLGLGLTALGICV
jgi:hypothetical protein